jgi:hypothetical protein
MIIYIYFILIHNCSATSKYFEMQYKFNFDSYAFV